jgi:hypothetical protein
MVSAKKFDGKQDLDVYIRTKIQYDYSFIEAAAVRIGDDIVEVGEYGDFAVNGVDTPSLGGKAGSIGGYPLVHTEVSKMKNTFDIVLEDGYNITLANFKNLVSVTITAEVNEKYFQDAEGLQGAVTGELFARDGKTIMDDMTEFGMEWQVRPDEPALFRTARAPQYPAQCIMPSKDAAEKRRLEEDSISLDAAQLACAEHVGKTFDSCVYDVMAVGDLELAQAGVY